MKTIFFIIIVISIILVSCEEDSDLKLPETESKLAVFGFLSPEDTVTNISVIKTSPYFGDKTNQSTNIISDAIVKIRHNDVETIFPFNAATNSYLLNSNEFKIIPGDEYSIEVIAPDYPTATSTIVIEEELNETLEFLDVQSTNYYSEVYFKVRWTDNANEKNFYRLTGYLQLEYYDFENDRQVEYLEALEGYSLHLYDDENWNGAVKTSNDLSCWKNFDSGVPTPLHLMLINADYHYYQYHKTVNDHNLFGDNPFSEPVVIYTNIENGTGIFCSYRKFEIIKDWTFIYE